jgi:hypothetical protein
LFRQGEFPKIHPLCVTFATSQKRFFMNSITKKD